MRQECPVLKALIKKHSLNQEMLTIQFLTHARANSYCTILISGYVRYLPINGRKGKKSSRVCDWDNDTLNLTVLPILSGSDYEFLNLLLHTPEFEFDVFARAEILTHLHTLCIGLH